MQENKMTVRLPQSYLDLLNQVFEIEKKVSRLKETNSIHRNINKMKDFFENIFSTVEEGNAGLVYENPIGEMYNETRADLESAGIAGHSAENLIITEVIKPIIRYRKGGINMIVQKGIVVTETKKD